MRVTIQCSSWTGVMRVPTAQELANGFVVPSGVELLTTLCLLMHG